MADEASENMAPVDHINVTVEAQTPSQSLPINTSTTEAECMASSVFKTGLLMSLVAIGGILNPPIAATTTTTITNKAHTFLSILFYVAIILNLAFGSTLILLSLVLHRVPEMFSMAKKMTEIGLAILRATLGFGTSLVLMVASSPWLALYVVFITIQFI